jgi:hypothetical protein
MALPGNRRLRCLKWLFHLALTLVLLGSTDLSFGQQVDGEVPFFNDSGSLTLPQQSNEELQESMPELQMFPSQDPPQMMPDLGASLDSPEL